MKDKRNKGITLIALVVTIIVLLILAGISIAMLSGNNGILQRATDAKRIAERAEAKEQAQLDILAWISDKISKNEDSSLNDSVIKNILTDKSYVKSADTTSFITKQGEYIIPYSELYNNNGTLVSPDVLDATGNIRITNFSIAGTPVTDVPLPSSDFVKVADTEIDNSYVARGKTGTDYEGDEFVWVPVDKNQEFTVKIEGSGNIANVVLKNPVEDTKVIASNITAPIEITGIEPTVEGNVYNGEYKVTVMPQEGDAIETTLDVYSLYALNVEFGLATAKVWLGDSYESTIQSMGSPKPMVAMFSQKSDSDIDYSARVAENGGFWIGRYEASYNSTTEKAGSKLSTSTRTGGNSTSLSNGMLWNCITRVDALATAKSYNTTLKSSLPTGAIWDRTLGWIYEKRNSTGKNLAEIDANSSSWGNYINNSLINTGLTNETMVNNIYDLAGNLEEWTTENYSSSYPIVRGGLWPTVSSFAAYRSYIMSENDLIDSHIGFRIVLYK